MIKIITFTEIEPYLQETRKLGLHFCNSTEYYGYYINEQLLGFTGILWYSSKAVFKNHYVLPLHRKSGIFNELFIFSLKEAKNRGIRLIEANCSESSIPQYLKFNGKITKQYKDWTKIEIQI